MKTLLSLLFVCATLFTQAQKTKVRALFIGNSYTGVNNLPNMTQLLTESLGDTLVQFGYHPGGQTFANHAGSATVYSHIRNGSVDGPWDNVILQGQSQEPAFSYGQFMSQTYPYASQLNDSIVANNACTETTFFMTWGRENGDTGNCQFFDSLCTYAGMQFLLTQRYSNMARDFDGNTSPVGAVWRYIRETQPSIELYTGDGSHPAPAGSYIAACTFYYTLFGKSPVGASYISSLTAQDAQYIQEAVAAVAIDSTDTWYIDTTAIMTTPTADFNATTTDLSANFSNNSTNANSYSWDFGDGETSNDASPSHTYAVEGVFQATLYAYSNCAVDSTNLFVTVTEPAATSIDELENTSIKLIGKSIELKTPHPGTICVRNLMGQTVFTRRISQGQSTINHHIPHGIYLISLTFENKVITKKIYIGT